MSLNFSNNTLYVKGSYIFIICQKILLITVCFESCVTSFLVKCSNKVTLLSTNCVGLEIDLELIFSIKVYKAANSL